MSKKRTVLGHRRQLLAVAGAARSVSSHRRLHRQLAGFGRGAGSQVGAAGQLRRPGGLLRKPRRTEPRCPTRLFLPRSPRPPRR